MKKTPEVYNNSKIAALAAATYSLHYGIKYCVMAICITEDGKRKFQYRPCMMNDIQELFNQGWRQVEKSTRSYIEAYIKIYNEIDDNPILKNIV